MPKPKHDLVLSQILPDYRGPLDRIKWASRFSTGNSNDKLVLLTLAMHGAESWPTIETICLYTDLSDSSVRRSIKRLQAVNVLSVVKHNKGNRREYANNVYRIDYRVILKHVQAMDNHRSQRTQVDSTTGHTDETTGHCDRDHRSDRTPKRNITGNEKEVEREDPQGGLFDGEQPIIKQGDSIPPVSGMDYLRILQRSIKWVSNDENKRAQAEVEIVALVDAHGIETIQEASKLWLQVHQSLPWLWEINDAVSALRQSKRVRNPTPPGQEQPELPSWVEFEEDED